MPGEPPELEFLQLNDVIDNRPLTPERWTWRPAGFLEEVEKLAQHPRTKALSDVRTIQYLQYERGGRAASENLWEKGRVAWRNVPRRRGGWSRCAGIMNAMLNLSPQYSPLNPSPIPVGANHGVDLGLFPPLPHAEIRLALHGCRRGTRRPSAGHRFAAPKPRIQPYNLLHAIRAADLFRVLPRDTIPPIEDRRPIIINDLKILARRRRMAITVILTEDRNTLSCLADRLRERAWWKVRALLLLMALLPANRGPGPG